MQSLLKLRGLIRRCYSVIRRCKERLRVGDIQSMHKGDFTLSVMTLYGHYCVIHCHAMMNEERLALFITSLVPGENQLPLISSTCCVTTVLYF